tara:strand:- start:74 stop:592 length:519 start_codon:yes stop_codon:yes gene_type:complete
MAFNRQYMGATGTFTAATVLFPPQSSIRIANTSGVNDPEAPVTLMRSAPNPNEIWRLSAGTVISTILAVAGPAQMTLGEVYIGKRLLGGLGTRWYHVQPTNQIADAATSIDINNTQRMQQSLRVHAGEELVLAVNDGGTAWDAGVAQQVQIPYEVAAGVTPAQNAASLRVWG